MPSLDPDAHQFRYSYLSRGQDVVLDAQGRIQVSSDYRDIAGLVKDVVIIGMQKMFEVWDSERLTHFERSKTGAGTWTSCGRGWRKRVSEAPEGRPEPRTPSGEGTHFPVLVDEVTFLLRPRRGGWLVDGTVGMGGHAERLLAAGGEETRLLGLDQDPEALRRAGARLARFGPRVTRPRQLPGDRAPRRRRRRRVRGERAPRSGPFVLSARRGAPRLLVPRRRAARHALRPTRGRTAAELLNSLPGDELSRILFDYGDERHARRIARRIAERRRRSPAHDRGPRAAVKEAVPRAAWSGRIHVATRTFQAVRMAVNDEIGAFDEALPHAARCSSGVAGWA